MRLTGGRVGEKQSDYNTDRNQIKLDITGKCIKAGVYMNFASLDRI